MKNKASFFAGFLVLFVVYHFPEFFHSFLLAALFKIGFLVVAILVARLQGWKGTEGYGLGFSGNWWPNLIGGLFAGTGAFVLSIIASNVFHFERIDTINSWQFFLNSLPLTLLMTFFPSIAEDILTRGYFLAHVKKLPPFTWILLTAAVYVLNHIWRLNDGLPVLSYLFILGLVLALCVVLTGSLWLTLGIHWGANLAFEMSRTGVKSTLVSHPDNPTWCLAGVWLLFFLLLMVVYGIRKPLSPDRAPRSDKG